MPSLSLSFNSLSYTSRFEQYQIPNSAQHWKRPRGSVSVGPMQNSVRSAGRISAHYLAWKSLARVERTNPLNPDLPCVWRSMQCCVNHPKKNRPSGTHAENDRSFHRRRWGTGGAQGQPALSRDSVSSCQHISIPSIPSATSLSHRARKSLFQARKMFRLCHLSLLH